jgi:hypothetical protein
MISYKEHNIIEHNKADCEDKEIYAAKYCCYDAYQCNEDNFYEIKVREPL